MEINSYDIIKIHTAMGKHVDLVNIKDNKLHLSWFSSNHSESLIVEDYSGFRDPFIALMERILSHTEAFNKGYGCSYKEDTKQYLALRSVYLNY